MDRDDEPHRAAGGERPLARAHEGHTQADGSYRLKGTKIFITYGEHDYTDNIIHLVLGRVEGAPEGVRGISLFVVPKFLVKPDGSLGERNDVKCVSIEHKLGIHASPTAVLAFGEKDGAVGYIVGEANRGLEYMFIMMNAARLSVGLEGVAVGERAYQRALGWARERLQGKPVGVAGAKTSADRPAPGREAHAPHDEVGDGSDARARLLDRGHARPREEASGRDGEASLPGDGRPADPGGEGLVHGERHRRRLPRHPGARRHGIHRGDGRRADTCATRASRRSTRARPASRRTTSSDARWVARRAARRTRSWRRWKSTWT
jgi:alkylation response protein AidB-like acyl-CoA dehydrogenase